MITKERVREIEDAQLTTQELAVMRLEALTPPAQTVEIQRVLGLSRQRVSKLKQQIDRKLRIQGWVKDV